MTRTDSLPFGGDLGDDVPHVARRQELSLLDVDRLAGAGRGHEEIGLPGQERRDLQHVDDLRRRRAACEGSWMSVRIGRPVARLDVGRIRRPSSSPGPRNECRDVRLALSYEALKITGTCARAAISRIASRRLDGVRWALDHARARDEGERTAAAHGNDCRSPTTGFTAAPILANAMSPA